jgi:hypothetical protein
MKKLIVILLVLFVNVLFGQENNYNKKHFFWIDIGIGHSNNWKDKQIPAKNEYLYFNQVTSLPSYLRKPNFYFESGITYKRKISKRFYVSLKANYSNMLTHRVYNTDTLKKYYLFPDSLKNAITLPFYNSTVTKRKYNFINLIPSIGYKYKRFGIDVGWLFNTVLFEKYHYEYENKSNYDKIDVQWFDYNIPMIKLNFIIIKNNKPISIFFQSSIGYHIGIEMQLN